MPIRPHYALFTLFLFSYSEPVIINSFEVLFRICGCDYVVICNAAVL